VSSAPKKSSAGKATQALPFNRYVVFFAIAVCGCATDLVTKQAIFRWRGMPGANGLWALIDRRLSIETSVNPGALFGMGAGGWRIFAIFSVVALIGIIAWLFIYRAAHDRWITVALGFVTGGILGNLYDRLGLWDSRGLPPELHHGVRDWIRFDWPEITLPLFNPWPNFNIADSLLVTGAIMLVVHAVVWREAHEPVRESKAAG